MSPERRLLLWLRYGVWWPTVCGCLTLAAMLAAAFAGGYLLGRYGG